MSDIDRGSALTEHVFLYTAEQESKIKSKDKLTGKFCSDKC